MSNYLLGFPNKKERDDFLIALVVLGFFAWIMLRFVGCDEQVETLPKVPAVEEVAVVADETLDDADGDGIKDRYDQCPNLAGIAENEGCPADADGDGVYDANDKCPNKAGTVENNGCPVEKDSDGDGIVDSKDKCPELEGIAANDGCPADADGDGVYDVDDKCPGKKGLAANNGCPEIKIEAEEAVLLKTAMRAVEFETGNAYLKRNSLKVLKQISGILNKYPKYKIDIIGHTDNVGDDAKNLQLSRDRAKACADYFVENGISASRIKHLGKGETRPVATNESELGRSENRRVEFKLHY